MAAAAGVRTTGPSTLAWGARAGLGRRAGLWEGEAEAGAAFGFVAPFGAGGPFARLGAGGGALSGAAGRLAYLTCPSAELGYQAIHKGTVVVDAGLRAGSILAGGVDRAGAPAAPLPPAAAVGAFAAVAAAGLAFEARLLHWGAGSGGPVSRARASGCWLRGVWGLCFDAGYERLGRGEASEVLTGGLSFGLGTLRGADDAER